MGKITKMQPNKFKEVIARQDQPKRPPTLGEPCEVTNWEEHIKSGHRLKHFAKIQPTRDGKSKEALVHTPERNQYFIAVKEPFCGYYYIWILCLTEGSDRINWRVNAGDVQFVLWDVPEEKLPSLDENLADKVKDVPGMHVK